MLILVPTAFEAGFLFGDTIRKELINRRSVPYELASHKVQVALCGFGLAAAGVGAAYELGEFPRDRTGRVSLPGVVLVGIAGTYQPWRVPVGSAILGVKTRCVGIGMGSGKIHQGAEDMGWPQGLSAPGIFPVNDCIPLFVPDLKGQSVPRVNLLSVTSVAATPIEAEERVSRHPDALAEDMESFAVGLATRLAEVSFTVVRGISNVAGDRHKDSWQIVEALTAAKEILLAILKYFHTEETEEKT